MEGLPWCKIHACDFLRLALPVSMHTTNKPQTLTAVRENRLLSVNVTFTATTHIDLWSSKKVPALLYIHIMCWVTAITAPAGQIPALDRQAIDVRKPK